MFNVLLLFVLMVVVTSSSEITAARVGRPEKHSGIRFANGAAVKRRHSGLIIASPSSTISTKSSKPASFSVEMYPRPRRPDAVLANYLSITDGQITQLFPSRGGDARGGLDARGVLDAHAFDPRRWNTSGTTCTGPPGACAAPRGDGAYEFAAAVACAPACHGAAVLPPPRLQPFIFTERDCGACYGRVMLSATRTVHIAIDKQPDGDEDKDDEAPRLLKEDEEEDDEEKAPRLPRALVAGPGEQDEEGQEFFVKMDKEGTAFTKFWLPRGRNITQDTVLSRCLNADNACILTGFVYDREMSPDDDEGPGKGGGGSYDGDGLSDVQHRVLCPDDACRISCNGAAGYRNNTGYSYDSVMCGVCADGYYRTEDKCNQCFDTTLLVGGIVSLGIIAFCAFVYKAVHNEGQEHRGTAFWRIVISFFTVNVGLANGMAARMPPVLRHLTAAMKPFEVYLFVFDPGTSFQCLAPEMSRLYKFVISALAPFAYIILVGLGVYCWGQVKRYLRHRDDDDKEEKLKRERRKSNAFNGRKDSFDDPRRRSTVAGGVYSGSRGARRTRPDGRGGGGEDADEDEFGKASTKKKDASDINKGIKVSLTGKITSSLVFLLYSLYGNLIYQIFRLLKCTSVPSSFRPGLEEVCPEAARDGAEGYGFAVFVAWVLAGLCGGYLAGACVGPALWCAAFCLRLGGLDQDLNKKKTLYGDIQVSSVTWFSLAISGVAGLIIGGGVGVLAAVGFFEDFADLSAQYVGAPPLTFLQSDLFVPCFTWADATPSCGIPVEPVVGNETLPATNATKFDTVKKCDAEGGVWGFCSDGQAGTALAACEAAGEIWVRDEGYRGVQFGAGLLLYLYLVCIPTVVLYITTRSDLFLHETHRKAVWGFLYAGVKIHWWELVLLVRKGLIAIILVFVADDPFLQSFYVLIVMLLSLVLQLQFRPFVDPMLNRLEAMCIETIIYTQATALAFHYVKGGGTEDPIEEFVDDEGMCPNEGMWPEWIDWAMIFVNVDTIIMIIWSFWQSNKEGVREFLGDAKATVTFSGELRAAQRANYEYRERKYYINFSSERQRCLEETQRELAKLQKTGAKKVINAIRQVAGRTALLVNSLKDICRLDSFPLPDQSDFAHGAMVEVNRNDKGVWFPGTIEENKMKREIGTYGVVYDDRQVVGNGDAEVAYVGAPIDPRVVAQNVRIVDPGDRVQVRKKPKALAGERFAIWYHAVVVRPTKIYDEYLDVADKLYVHEVLMEDKEKHRPRNPEDKFRTEFDPDDVRHYLRTNEGTPVKKGDQVEAKLMRPVKLFCRTLFQIEYAALHSYDPDPHSLRAWCSVISRQGQIQPGEAIK